VTEHSTSAAQEPVGSLGEEAVKLFRAMAAQGHTASDDSGSDDSAGTDTSGHVCTTTWCPVCQVAGLVREHPEAVAKVSDAATQLTRSLRELIDTALTPRDDT
jgi:hypothetical protein